MATRYRQVCYVNNKDEFVELEMVDKVGVAETPTELVKLFMNEGVWEVVTDLIPCNEREVFCKIEVIDGKLVIHELIVYIELTLEGEFNRICGLVYRSSSGVRFKRRLEMNSPETVKDYVKESEVDFEKWQNHMNRIEKSIKMIY